MRKNAKVRLFLILVTIGVPVIMSHPVFADSNANVTQIESFLQSIIQVLAALAGLVATGFFVLGGFSYITSSGNPENLVKAKRTLLHSGIGLAIVIAAYVISSIITSLATKAFGS